MVENFGLYLKNERELRGVHLEEIAESTKIHIRFLEALENNEFNMLPGEVFIKGYIRSYAKVIGIDAEDIVNTYDETAGKDRKEEFEKVQVVNEKIRSRKKMLAGYVLAGIALTGVFIMGYLVVSSMVEKNKKEPTQLLHANDPSLAAGESENISNKELPREETDNEENPAQEIQSEFLQDESSPPRVKAKTKSDPAVESSLPPVSSQTLPEGLKPEIEKIEIVATGPKPPLTASASQEKDKKEPETPEKSAESEKKSDFPKKGVIIQYVAEKSEAAESDPNLSESDSKPLHLKIQVQGNSWFNVTVDDGGEEDFILPGGSSKNIYGSKKFRVTIGNRWGTHLFLNGQSIDLPPGSNDVIRDFDITANLIQ